MTGILPGSRPKAGEVLVHGDFLPNNLLFGKKVSVTHEALTVVAVLDWEWAHIGQRIEDLAWCEWIVRMNHPAQVNNLDDFFADTDLGRPGQIGRQRR